MSRTSAAGLQVALLLLWAFATSSSAAQSAFPVRTELETNGRVLIREALPYLLMEAETRTNLALKKEPAYRSAAPAYGKVSVGNSLAKKDVAVVADEAEGERPLVYLDLNNNRDLTDDGPPHWEEGNDGGLGKEVRILVTFLVGGKAREISLPYSVSRIRDERRKQTRILFQPRHCRKGTVRLGGREYLILVQTFNKQGLYSKPEDLTVGVDWNRDGEVDRGLLSAEIFWGGAGGGKPFNVGGESYRVAGATDFGDEILLEVSPVKVPPKHLIKAGAPAPDFEFLTLTGSRLRLSSFRGRVVLLDFWATWCGPCVAALPAIKAAYERYDRSRFEVIGISLDGGDSTKTTRGDVEKFVGKEGVRWPVAFDDGGWDSGVALTYNVTGIPIHVVIDKAGAVRLVERGGGLEAMGRIDAMIASLMRE